MNFIKIAICDDEPIFRQQIIEYLQSYGFSEDIFTSEFDSGESLLESYRFGNKFDLIFIDIIMKKLSGVDTAREIRRMDNSVMFIFITAFSDYIRDAFCINAFQYLLKPIVKEIFNEELDRAILNYRNMKSVYQITYNDVTSSIKIIDILYIETYKRHLRVRTSTIFYEYLGILKEEEVKLAMFGFVRCHQGYLVNMRYINKIEANVFKLINNETIPISKHIKKDVVSNYLKYISEFCI